jgi:hypothetical protein
MGLIEGRMITMVANRRWRHSEWWMHKNAFRKGNAPPCGRGLCKDEELRPYEKLQSNRQGEDNRKLREQVGARFRHVPPPSSLVLYLLVAHL